MPETDAFSAFIRLALLESSGRNPFKNGLKADTDAVMLLAKAIEALSKYATNNKLALTQKKANKHAAMEAAFSAKRSFH